VEASIELFGRFLRILALVSGGVLLLLTGVTVVDVVLRYVFNAPFSGTWEFTEFSMAIIVWLGIGYCGWTGGHISVDLLEKQLDRPGLRWLPGVIALVSSALFALIAWQVAVEAVDAITQASNMLRWPHYPFRFTVAFGSAMFALVLLIQGVDMLRGRPRRE
jgi:TRAP-type C4-dicarboxylate transport system permease small subunit